MARFTIKSADGQQNRYTGCPTYHGTFLKPAYIEFTQIASPVPIAWGIGDYVDYTRTGFRYKLYAIPQPEKSAVQHAAGDSFMYKDVQLYCATKDLEIAPFRDLVISDNLVHFTTLPDVATFEDVYGIARRIQANVDSFYGAGTWVIKVFDTSDSDLRAVMLQTKEFSMSDGSCLDALSKIYELWKGIGWVYSVENGVNTITIGRANVQDRDNTTSVFAYGVGNGIKVIKKEQSAKNDLATRLYAYGSTRNMIARYYNNITPPIKDNESVYIPNLMLPLSEWGTTDNKKDASKAFLEADSGIIARYGLRPKTIYFDGSGDYEEICPSIEGMTAGQIRAAMQSTDDYYPSTAFFPDDMRVDEVARAENPSDNGVISTESGGKYAQTVSVLGVAYSLTRPLSVGENQARVSLTNISVANTISASGKVHVDTAFQGTIACDETLSIVSVVLWLEIGGVKYGERPATVVRGTHGVFTVSLEPFDINTENTGNVSLKGYVEFERPSTERSTQVLINLAPGTTTLSVEFTPAQTFTVEIPQVGFDISKQQSSVSGGICTISFKSGWCAGRDFTVKKCEYVAASDRWRLTVARQSDDSIGQYFPNSVYRVEQYDRFVLIDLTMPEIYHTAAEQRLLERASEVLDAISTPKYVYEPEIDAKVLAKNPETLLEGMYMPLWDTNVVGDETEFVLIDSLEINEGAEAIPTYRVTLQDEKRENFIARLTKESGRNSRTITEITLRDLRNEVEELTPSVTTDNELYVRVVASHPIIGYKDSFDEEPVNTVVLTCETKGIDNPTYQWYFRGAISWVPIPSATGQSYTVDPDGSLYYLDGEVVEDFRCVVSGDEGLSATVQIMKVLSNALTFSLSNPSHIFKAGEEYAIADTDASDILGYRGVERIETNVKQSAIRFLNTDGTVIPASYAGGHLLESTGKYLTDSDGKYLVVAGAGGAGIYDTDSNLMMSVEVVNNNTASAYLSIAVTNKMNIPVGKIEIPIIIQEAEGSNPEKIVKLYYSWALALKGDSPLIADITNEADGVAVGSDGKLSATVTLTTQVILYYGMNAETLSSVVPTIPAAYVSKISSVSAVINTGGKSATVTVTLAGTTANPIDYTGINQIDIPIAVTGARGTRNVTFSILFIKEGEDGAVFMLQPSADVIKGTRNNDNTISYDQTGITCSRMMRKGLGELSPSTYGVLKMSVDGGTTKIAYAAIANTDSNWTALIAAGKVIYYWFSDNAETTLIDRETIPVVVDGAKGDNGYSASTVYLYRRSSSGTSGLSVPASNYKYRFSDGKIYATSDTTFTTPLSVIENWYVEIPSGDDPCYVTMAFVQGNGATADLLGGLNTANGSWSPITRLTGDNGLMGKVMRGINEFSSNGLPNGRPDGQGGYVAGYQGMQETDPSIIYYDMVYVESGGTRTYYYCKNGVGAQNHAPGVSGSGWADYWVVATQFDFIATRVLLASNAAIDILSGNAVYMYDDGQSYIVAGVQGGTLLPGSVNDPQISFFAGTHPETSQGAGDAVTPATAPFRVTYGGQVYCSDIEIVGGSIQIKNGSAVAFSVSNTGDVMATNVNVVGGKIVVNAEVEKMSDNTPISIKTDNGIRGKYLWVTEGSGQNLKELHADGSLTNTNVPLLSLLAVGGFDALSVSGGTSRFAGPIVATGTETHSGAETHTGAETHSGNMSLSASANNKIGNEYIISSATMKHFVDIEESDYDALEQAGTLDANTTYFVYPDGYLS